MDKFHSLNNIKWYSTAYLLTIYSFQLLIGKIYKFYSAKLVFLTSIILFEVGLAIYKTAPSLKAFIISYTIARLGSSKIFLGVMVIIFYIIPL